MIGRARFFYGGRFFVEYEKKLDVNSTPGNLCYTVGYREMVLMGLSKLPVSIFISDWDVVKKDGPKAKRAAISA
jgi:hypothetical protein